MHLSCTDWLIRLHYTWQRLLSEPLCWSSFPWLSLLWSVEPRRVLWNHSVPAHFAVQKDLFEIYGGWGLMLNLKLLYCKDITTLQYLLFFLSGMKQCKNVTWLPFENIFYRNTVQKIVFQQHQINQSPARSFKHGRSCVLFLIAVYPKNPSWM